MNNNFLESGNGRPLRLVTGSTGNVVVEDIVIPDGDYSETFSASDCLEFMLLFYLTADESESGSGDESEEGSIVIEQVLDSQASDGGEEFDTITVTTERIERFSAGEALTGTFRVHNMSGRSLTAYLQKRIN